MSTAAAVTGIGQGLLAPILEGGSLGVVEVDVDPGLAIAPEDEEGRLAGFVVVFIGDDVLLAVIGLGNTRGVVIEL